MELENLLKLLSEVLDIKDLPQNVKFTEDEEGNVTITYKNKKKVNPELVKIKEELDAMPDDLFAKVTEIFKKECPQAYEDLSTLSNPNDESKVIKAYANFKLIRNRYVYQLVQDAKVKAADWTKRAEELTETYLK